MAYVAPQGPVYQAGTLSGNPLAMAAGLASLEQLRQEGFYESLNQTSEALSKGLRTAAQKAGIPVSINLVGSMLGLFFTELEIKNFSDAKKSNLASFNYYYGKMLEKGIYLAPSQFEALFVSIAHETKDIIATVSAAQDVLSELAAQL